MRQREAHERVYFESEKDNVGSRFKVQGSRFKVQKGEQMNRSIKDRNALNLER
jgi:aromatic ring-cleaving dioxygenase